MPDRVALRARGFLLERFLNLALAEGVRFAEIRREDRRQMCVVTDAAGAKKLLSLAEKYRLDCSVCERRGPGALLRRARSRLTLLAGLLLCIACAWLFLSRVWLIDVTAAADGVFIDADAIRAEVRSLGIFPGLPRAEIDTVLLEEQLDAGSSGCAYIGVSLEGVRLLIEAAPEAPEPEVFDIAAARDLVAAADGIVVSVNVWAGRACVKQGDTVQRGQTLIRGEERVSGEASRGVRALGEVVARTWFTGEAVGTRTELTRRYTGRTSASATLRLLNLRLPLYMGEALRPAEAEAEVLPVGGLFLPLAVERETLREYVETRVEADPAALRRTLEATATLLAEARMLREAGPDCRAVRRWIDYPQENAHTLRARAVLEAERNIAVTIDSLFQGGS